MAIWYHYLFQKLNIHCDKITGQNLPWYGPEKPGSGIDQEPQQSLPHPPRGSHLLRGRRQHLRREVPRLPQVHQGGVNVQRGTVC